MQIQIQRAFGRLKQTYALDIRALSLMRILIAGLLITDLIIRATSLTAFYTNEGVSPFKEIEMSFWRDGYFSLFQFNDNYWYAALLFCLTGIIYFFLLIGYRTRLFSVLAWLMLLSIQNRNHAILQCGDDELRLILFWGVFLPWGNFYSLDAKRKPSMQNEIKYFNVPGIAYVLLVFSVYFFTGILKDSPEWDMREGNAYYYALSLDQITWPLGKMLLPHTGLLKFFTVTAKWMEVGLPFLLFIPYKNEKIRTWVVVILAAFHFAIALTLFVGLFYLISIFSLTGLLGSHLMDRVDRLFGIKRSHHQKSEHKSFLQSIGENYYFKVLVNCFVFFCMALCMIWNLGSVEWSGLKVSDRAFKFGYMLKLDQRWNMFAPTVLKDDGWFMTDAVTSSGKHLDVYRNGEAVNYAKPDNVLKYIKDDRWRKYQENFMFDDNLFMRDYYCKYMIRDWNNRHPEDTVDSLRLYFMREKTPPPGGTTDVKKELICKCAK